MKRLLLTAALVTPIAAHAQIITPAPSSIQPLYITGTSVGNGADTTEDTLQTFTMGAGQLANVGDSIHVRAGGVLATTTDTKFIRLKIGTTIVSQISENSAAAGGWTMDSTITKTGTNTQSYITTLTFNGFVSATRSGTLAITDTGSLAVTITGQNTTTASANSITCQLMALDYQRAP